MTLFYKTRLMTPGPTQVPEEVLLEMAQPIIHHRTEAFQQIFASLSDRLKHIFRTKNPVLTIAGSGTTAFEAAQLSLINPGEKALTLAGGKFGERWQDIYESVGIEQVRINADWGDAPDPADVEKALKDNPEIKVITAVHSETSTATASDVKAIAGLAKEHDALLIVDGITSVGAFEVEQDDWGIDVLVTGSQKAMMLPPGLGFVSLGERAVEKLNSTQGMPAYNLDLRKWLKSYEKNDVPFTPPVSLIRGQNLACQMILEQGMERIWQRNSALAAAARAAVLAMDLKLLSSSPSDSVTGAYYPDSVSDKDFRNGLRDEFGIHIAGGQDGRGGKLKGKIFRISHMGYVDAGDLLTTLAAIEKRLVQLGHSVEPGAGISAAMHELA